jgi:hypothetical protein
MNFKPRPRRKRRFLGGVKVVVVRSWKARLVGRLKYWNSDNEPRRREALWLVEKAGFA